MQIKNILVSRLPIIIIRLLKYLGVTSPLPESPLYRLLAGWQQYKEARIIKRSRQFDPDFYLRAYPEVAESEKWCDKPFDHYVKHGAKKNLSPRPGFDANFYLQNNPDVPFVFVNPFVHYLKLGFFEGRLSCRDADLFHEWICFARTGSGRNLLNLFQNLRDAWYIYKSKQFSTLWYWAENPDVLEMAEKSKWWRFRTGRNRLLYPIGSSFIHPIHHFLRYGIFEGRYPNADFDPRFYIRKNLDVRVNKINPFVHYLRYGHNENRPSNDRYFSEKDMGEIGFDDSGYKALSGGGKNTFQPKISVIVPNYNHEKYLNQRLDTVYNQTYDNIEVILLDDCSRDKSRNILMDYAKKYSDITRTAFNEQNSGNVFRQWASGIQMATGEFVWIAESDDYCDLDFLERLVPFFRDESVMIAYSNVAFIDSQNKSSEFAYPHYLAPLGAERWECSHTVAAHREVERALGILNIIPNASGCIFRKRDHLDVLNDPQWLQMKICGDWVFYLHQICGGKLSYCAETFNYFRFHDDNSSHKTYRTPNYYQEHEAVARNIARLYAVSSTTIESNHTIIRRFWAQQAGDDLKTRGFENFYHMEKVNKARYNRGMNIMIAVYSFSIGGGEVLPIHLANALSRMGLCVTVMEFSPGDRDVRVRGMLDSGIPVVTCPSPDRLRQYIRDFGIDIFNSHHAGLQNLFADAFPSDERPKHIAVTHGLFDTMSHRELKACMEKMCNRVDHWVYVAEKNLDPFKKMGLYQKKRFIKLSNGIDHRKIVPVPRSSLGIRDDAFVLCLVSRAMPEKGWIESIEIVKRARQRCRCNIELLLVGDGEMEQQLRKEKLPAYIHLLGFKDNPCDFFATADMGFLPSRYKAESAPLTIIESFLAGRPVIASNLGEVSSMLDAGNGETAGAVFDLKNWKIPVDDVAQLVAEFAMSPDRLSRASELAKTLSITYEIENIAKQYKSLFYTYCNTTFSQAGVLNNNDKILTAKKGTVARPTLSGHGICPVCRSYTVYTSYNENNDWFNSYRCRVCQSLPRDRAVQHLLDLYYPGWRFKSMHECSPCNDLLEKVVEDYSASQYYPGYALGEKVGKFYNENLEDLTFEDNDVDFFMALEVLEHLFHPEEAVKEMVRSIRPGGAVIFTTCPGAIKTSYPRATINPDTDKITYLLDPVYHGNPVAKGALLTWDFGQDLFKLVEKWSGIKPIVWNEINDTIGLPQGGLPCVFLLAKE